MKILQTLSPEALVRLVIAMGVQSPIARLAPRFWSFFADVIACETARRHGIVTASVPLPDLSDDELEGAGVGILAIADSELQRSNADAVSAELAVALLSVGEGIVLLRRAPKTRPAEC
jgi:hypothetical protein